MEEVKVVDARGLSCPEPTMMARQALAALGGGRVEVLVDSGTSRDNVSRVAERLGWRVAVEDAGDGYRLVISK